MRPGALRYLLGAAFLSLPARAEVGLDMQGCDSLAEASLREHLSLELRTLGVEHATPSLHLRCEGALVIVALTRDTGQRHPVEVRVELDATARGERERLVALAASELIAQAEPAPGSPRAQEGTAPLARERQARPVEPPWGAGAQAPTRAHELFLAGSGGIAGSQRTQVWGVALGARVGFGPWSLLLDTRFERGAEALALADVRWSSLSGFVGASIAARGPYYEVSAGLGGRAGWLGLEGRARPPHFGASMNAPWVGVALPLRASLLTAGRVHPIVGLEGGYVLLPVNGRADDGSLLVSQRGAWLTATLGVGVRL